MIRIQTLRVFVTVADCGNIRDAAKILGRTVSAVSMTLKQLEEHLGASLFETDRKHTLTALGEEICKLARDLLREHDRITDSISAIAAGREGTLKIAAVPSVAAQLLPSLLSSMLVEHPGIRIDLLDTDSVSVHMLVENGEVDIGIGGKPVAGRGLRFTALFDDPFRLVCRKDHPLADHAAPLSKADLQGHRLIRNNSTAGFSGLDDEMPQGASMFSARNVISLLALVRAGAGATILPALATRAIDEELCALKLDDVAARRTVGFILRQKGSSSPVCAAFQKRFLSVIIDHGMAASRPSVAT
ncbi:Hydrogen peroxide-inducible genes activator [Roseibaca ekhonensis]|uniref:Hydrogen peroxide-inducible genes activator n=1 Tax=Roseinatronobacter ekhonensis TaxID=254356 RepID=A0A3B0M755_9RHOB|nr:Hydrogen peroxide-inducible genes activator [Roseibaca ekhonensis]